MNSDIQAIGMAPVIHEFMGKQRKLRNLRMDEDIDLEVAAVELNNFPAPLIKLTHTVEVEVEGEEGEIKTVEKVEAIPYEEAVKMFKKEVAAYKKKVAKLRENYLLLLFDDGQITPEEIQEVTTREWNALRKKLNRQNYYDMGLTDIEIDEIERTAVKGSAQGGFPNQDVQNNLS